MLLATEKSCPLATEVDKVNEFAQQFVTSIKKSNEIFKDTIDVSKGRSLLRGNASVMHPSSMMDAIIQRSFLKDSLHLLVSTDTSKRIRIRERKRSHLYAVT